MASAYIEEESSGPEEVDAPAPAPVPEPVAEPESEDEEEEAEESEVDWAPVPSSDAVWFQRDARVPIERLEWDSTAKHGQIRMFDQEYAKKRILEMMQKEPVGLLNVVLVCKDHAGMKKKN